MSSAFDQIASELFSNPVQVTQARPRGRARHTFVAPKKVCEDGTISARYVRHRVEVIKPDGRIVEFRSTPAAFQALHLPKKQMIRFRLLLKASGREVITFEGRRYEFVLLPW